MTKQVFKAIALGILVGLALFSIPFFLMKAVIFILLLRMIFGIFGRRRFGPGPGRSMAFARSGNVSRRDCGFSARESVESPNPEHK